MRRLLIALVLLTISSIVVLLIALVLGPDAQVRQEYARKQLSVESTINTATLAAKIDQANFDLSLERVKGIVGFIISTLFNTGLYLIGLIFLYRRITDTSWIGRIIGGMKSILRPSHVSVIQQPAIIQSMQNLQALPADTMGMDAVMRELPPVREMRPEEESELIGTEVAA